MRPKKTVTLFVDIDEFVCDNVNISNAKGGNYYWIIVYGAVARLD